MKMSDISPLTRYAEEADASAERQLQDVVMASATFILWERLYSVATVSPTLDRLNLYCYQEFQKEGASPRQQHQHQSTVPSKANGVHTQRPRSILTDSALFLPHTRDTSNYVPGSTMSITDIDASNKVYDKKYDVKVSTGATEVKSRMTFLKNAPMLSSLEAPQPSMLPQLSNVTSIAHQNGLFTAQQPTYHTVAEDVTLPFSVDASVDNEKDSFRLSEVLRVDEPEDVRGSESCFVSNLSGTSVSISAPADPTRLTDAPQPYPDVADTTSASPLGLSSQMRTQNRRKTSSPRGKLSSSLPSEQSIASLSHAVEEMQTCRRSLSGGLITQDESQISRLEHSFSSSPDTQRSHLQSSRKERQSGSATSASCPIQVQPLGVLVSEAPRRLSHEDEEASTKDTYIGNTELDGNTLKTPKGEQTTDKTIKREKGTADDDSNGKVILRDDACVKDLSVLSGCCPAVLLDSDFSKHKSTSDCQFPKLSIDRESASPSNVSKVQRRSRRYRPPPFFDVAQREIIDETAHDSNTRPLPLGESVDSLVFSPEKFHLVSSPSMEKGLSPSLTPCVAATVCDTPEPLFAYFSKSPENCQHHAANATISGSEPLLNDGERSPQQEEGEVLAAVEEGEEEAFVPQLTPLYAQASEPPLSVSPSPSYKDYEWAARAQAALEMQQQRLRARTSPSASPPGFASQPPLQVGGFELPQLPKGRPHADNAEHSKAGCPEEAKADRMPIRIPSQQTNPRATSDQLTPRRPRGRQRKQSHVSPALAESMDKSPPPVAPTRTPPVAASRKRSLTVTKDNKERTKKRRRVSPQSTEAGAGAEFLLPRVMKTSSNVRQEKKK